MSESGSEEIENVMTLRQIELLKPKVQKSYRMPEWKLKLNAFNRFNAEVSHDSHQNDHNLDEHHFQYQEDIHQNSHLSTSNHTIHYELDSIEDNRKQITDKCIDLNNNQNNCTAVNQSLNNSNESCLECKSMAQKLNDSQNECLKLKKMLNMAEINCKILQRKLSLSENIFRLQSQQERNQTQQFVQNFQTNDISIQINNSLQLIGIQSEEEMIGFHSKEDHKLEPNLIYGNQESIEEKRKLIKIRDDINQESNDEISEMAQTFNKRRSFVRALNMCFKETTDEMNEPVKCEFCGKSCEKKSLNIHLGMKHKLEWSQIRTTKPKKRSKVSGLNN